uniref:Expressed conserved protein n=1 Tax=Echinococcus granulosus TaxID=6210 RepID=A0A068X565_ECHGR|nr:hypothetical protein EgrG_002057800 [Echinococcus granulosus]
MVKNCAMEENAVSPFVIAMPSFDDWPVGEEDDTDRLKIEMLGYMRCAIEKLSVREGKAVEEGTEMRVNVGASKSETVRVKTNKNQNENIQKEEKVEETQVVEFEAKKNGGGNEKKNGGGWVNVDVVC